MKTGTAVSESPGTDQNHRLTDLMVAGVILLAVLFSFRQISSLDAGFHLKTGGYILAHGWPTTDSFTYTVNDHRYTDMSWGYQIMLYGVNRLGGNAGMVLFTSALVAGLFIVLYRSVKLVRADPISTPVLFLVAVLACESRFNIRPEHTSYLYLALMMHILYRHAESKRTPLWVLPILQLFWTNTHGLFMMGLAVQGCTFLGLMVRDRRPDFRLAAWSLASAAVIFINPYGCQGATEPFFMLTRLRADNLFYHRIAELISPFNLVVTTQYPFLAWVNMYSFRGFLVLSGLALWPALRRRRYWIILNWLVFAAVATRA
ncbi:hypothetical protein JW905_07105, partial [bacterium]|nr:hypothetical protein [candidate division CSSED10-310 bacterium]